MLHVTCFMQHAQVLLSTQMYVPLDSTYINPYLDRMLTTITHTHALIHTCMLRYLTRHVVQQERETNVMTETTTASTQPSLLYKLGSSMKHLLLLPVHVFHYFFPAQPTSHPLADRYALLFLLLIHQQTHDAASHATTHHDVTTQDATQHTQPYRQAVTQFHDATYHDATVTHQYPIPFATSCVELDT